MAVRESEDAPLIVVITATVFYRLLLCSCVGGGRLRCSELACRFLSYFLDGFGFWVFLGVRDDGGFNGGLAVGPARDARRRAARRVAPVHVRRLRHR